MKVRMFVPSPSSSADEPVFCGTDHTFPSLPSIGQAVRFTDHRRGDFTVVTVGYVQDADAFLPAVWLTSNDIQMIYSEQAVPPRVQEYRDLNHDVPPASMTTY
mgnify:CR=1 FL=1